MKLPCTIIEDILPLYADGICSEESRLCVEEHCAECSSCNKKLCAMCAELPEKKPGGKPKNPLKKIIRHYLKLCFFTLLCSALVGTLASKAVELTANENDPSSAGKSWSTLKYERDFGKFGRLFKEGKYYEAMSMADLPQNENLTTITPEEQDEMYRDYAKALENFFALCPEYSIKSYSVDSYNYDVDGGYARVDVYFRLETPRKAPVSVVYRFAKSRRDSGGRFRLWNQAKSCEAVIDGSVSSQNTNREDLTGIMIDRHNVNVSFPKLNFPDNWAAVNFRYCAERGEYLSDAAEYFVTRERQKRADLPMTLEDESNNDAARFYRSAPLTDEERDKIVKQLEKLFTGEWECVSFEYDAPRFYDETIYKDLSINESGCFKQDFTLTMKKAGKEFSVRFTAPVTIYGYMILPAENIVFSENAPEDFKEAFLELFAGENKP